MPFGEWRLLRHALQWVFVSESVAIALADRAFAERLMHRQ